MELTEFQKAWIDRADRNRPVYFQYEIADCEHRGDIERAGREVMEFLGKYDARAIKEFWDGKDCGEAYLIVEIPFKYVKEVFRTRFFKYDPWQ